MVLFLEIRKAHISFTHQKRQNVPQTEEIVAVNIFPVLVIIVKVNPAVLASISIYKNMIASYVAVLFTLLINSSIRTRFPFSSSMEDPCIKFFL